MAGLHADHRRALNPDASWTLADGREVRTTHVCDVRIESGKLLVCDPMYALGDHPLPVRVPAGEHAVIVTIDAHGLAALALRFEDDVRPSRWRKVGGVSIDSGNIAVLDARGRRELARIERQGRTIVEWIGYEARELGRLQLAGPISLGDDEAGEIVALSTGFGDGTGTVWLALTAERQPIGLVADLAFAAEPLDQ